MYQLTRNFNTLYKFFSINYMYAIIFVVMLLCWFCIYKMLTYKLSNDYKIYTSKLNWLYILLYILFYIVLIFLIRYYAWGNHIDLKKLYLVLNYNLIPNRVLLALVSLTIIYLIFCSYFIFRKFLIKECKKRYIILSYNHNRRITQIQRYCYFISDSYYYLNKTFAKLFKRPLTSCQRCYTLYRYLIISFPYILLWYLIMYDCYYNNFKLILITYYMPFFIIILLISNFTQFLKSTEPIVLNRMLYQKYYMKHYIRYIDVTEEENQYIDQYLSRGLQIDFNTRTSTDIEERLWLIRRCASISKLQWSNGVDTWENTEYDLEQQKGPESDLEIPEPKEFSDNKQ